jgi:hypothetical protein
MAGSEQWELRIDEYCPVSGACSSYCKYLIKNYLRRDKALYVFLIAKFMRTE